MNTDTMLAAARARGLDAEPAEHADDDWITVNLTDGGATLYYGENADGLVEVTLFWPTWSYRDGPDSVERLFGCLPVSEAFSYVVWLDKMTAAQEARTEAMLAEAPPYMESIDPDPAYL